MGLISESDAGDWPFTSSCDKCGDTFSSLKKDHVCKLSPHVYNMPEFVKCEETYDLIREKYQFGKFSFSKVDEDEKDAANPQTTG